MERALTPMDRLRGVTEPLRRALAVLRRLGPNRRIRFTAQGIWITLLTLGVGFAALNTGNNLLYLVLGMMLTLIGVSGILSELSIQRLKLTRRFPGEIFAERPTSVRLRLENLKRVFPAMGVRILEARGLDADVPGGFVVFLSPKQGQDLVLSYVFRRRGRHRIPRPIVETSYPFGLFRRGFNAAEEVEVLVFPAVVPLEGAGTTPPSGGGEELGRRRGTGDEFYGLRAFHIGDDIRQVHWKISAKRDRLVVRESVELTRRRTIIRLEAGDGVDRGAFEEAVSLAASWAQSLLGQGFAVGFEGPGELIPPGEGRGQLRRILTLLALVAPADGPVGRLPGPPEQDRRLVITQRGSWVYAGWA